MSSGLAVSWHPTPALSTSGLVKSDAEDDRHVDVDTSSDGLIAYAIAQRVVSSRPVYTAKVQKSSDGGVTWSELASAPAGYWTSVATSSDGGTVAIVGTVDGTGTGHRLLVSINGGTTWSPQNTNTQAYTDVAVSADGTTMVVARPTSGVEYSTSGGTLWTQVDRDPVTSGVQVLDVDNVAVSANGSVIVASQDGGTVWRSINGGGAWSELPGQSSIANWQDIAISDDGATVFGVVFDDEGYIWKGLASPTLYATGDVGLVNQAARGAISPDGRSFIVGSYNARPRVLRNWNGNGTTNPATLTWESQETSQSVLGLSITNAGTRFVVVTENGGIWAYSPTLPAPVITSAIRFDYDGNAACEALLIGPESGGTRVRIDGRFFPNATATVGGVAATVVSIDPSGERIVISVPRGVAGTAPLVVTTPGGSATVSGGFTYLAQPTGWERIGATLVGETDSEFGNNVALSADGTVAAVSAPSAEVGAAERGLVRVFAWSGSTWVQRGGDITGIEDYERFGSSLAMSADGNTIAVGAPRFDDTGSERGQVRVFRWLGGAWVQQGVIDGAGIDIEFFGHAVAMAADGETVVVSTYRTRRARVFEWSGTTWAQVGRDIDDGGLSGSFGFSVAMSGDAQTVVVGAPGARRARVFRLSGTTWAQAGADILGGIGSESFGYALAVNADGDVVAIGDPDADLADPGSDVGFVRVMYFDGASWAQRGGDVVGNDGEYLGAAVDVSEDGGVLAYSAPGACRYNYSGEIVVLSWNGTSWVQRGGFLPAQSYGGGFGNTVAIDGDGETVMASDIQASTYAGESYVWRYGTTTAAATPAGSVAVVDSAPVVSNPVVAPITELPVTGFDGQWWAAMVLILLGGALVASSARSRVSR